MLPENESSSINSVKFQDIKLRHRNLLHSYTLKTKEQKEKLKKQSKLLSLTKRIKYLFIHLPKKAKDLYFKSYDTDERT